MLSAKSSFLFVLTFSVATSCPDGFLTHASSCYMAFAIRTTWAEASIICQAYGGNLAVINDLQEQHFIESYIGRNIGGFTPGTFWLGAEDIQIDGEWKWNGTQTFTTSTFTNWAPNEPDNKGNHEHCLGMSLGNKYLWSDLACENRLNFVCELPATIPVSGPEIIG